MSDVLSSIDVLLYQLSVSRQFSVATFVLLVYDHLLTFSDEVRFIWGEPWSLAKALFLIVRYTTPVVVAIDLLTISEVSPPLPNSFCMSWFGFALAWQLLSFTLINILTALRTIAIWGRRKDISRLVWTALVINAMIMTALTAKTMHDWLPTISYLEVVHVCIAERPQTMWAIWCAPVVYEFFIFTLTSIKTIQHIRVKGCPTLRTVARDGLWYFAVLFLSRLFNLLLWLLAPIPLLLMGVHCAWALVTITCNRLFINLRTVASDDVDVEEDSFEMYRHHVFPHSEDF